jgi:hypothetical protein
MRMLMLALSLSATSLLAACGDGKTAGPPRPSASPAAGNTNRAAATNSEIGVVSSHGGGNANATTSGVGSSERGLVDTAELDERIKGAAAKAKQAGASDAAKRAAAAAYLERGNVYYSAGNPRLYKYALADFREVLRYDAANAEARQKLAQIEDIYRSLGRPFYGSALTVGTGRPRLR